jgi:broad-specificity NMP kinase
VIVFLYGPHGVGKTTTGNTLQSHYQWRHFDFDYLLYNRGYDRLKAILKPVNFGLNTVLSFGYRADYVSFITGIANQTNALRIWLEAPRQILDNSLRKRGISDTDLMNIQNLSVLKMQQELTPDVTMPVINKNGCRLNVAARINKKYWTRQETKR